MANKSMGEFISMLRKEKGMTQKELAYERKIRIENVPSWFGWAKEIFKFYIQ